MKSASYLCAVALAAGLAGCDRAPAPDNAAPAAAPATTTTAAASRHDFDDAINASDFAEHVQTLASDAFEGRGPGSAGEEKSVAYIESQFKRIGLKPGNGDSYFQTVPMIETRADAARTRMTINVAGKAMPMAFG